jgi:hypothetical protein
MSDGPYRTLPMISACKRWAKRAHHSAFDRQDIADAVGPALAAHWTAEVSKELLSALWSICDPRQTALFDDGYAAKLDTLRGMFAGQGILGNVLIDCVEQNLADGKVGREALHNAAHATLLDQTARDIRTTEEHYLRESTARKAIHVRERMLDGVSIAPVREIAGRLIDQSAPIARVPPKRGGLDDGVRL